MKDLKYLVILFFVIVSCSSGGGSDDSAPIQDTTAPTAPTNLTGISTSTTTIDLNWTAATDKTSGVSYYEVAVGTTPGGTDIETWTSVGSGLSGEVSASYGNFDAYTLDGHLNAGSDVIAVRLAGAYKKREGYVTNLAPNQNDHYAKDQLGVRASFRFTPSTDFTAELILTYDRQRNSGTPFISGSLPTSAGPADPFGVADLRGSPFSAAVLGDGIAIAIT